MIPPTIIAKREEQSDDSAEKERNSEYPETYYAASADTTESYPVLQEEIETEICIVGAGYAGLSTALGLVERGKKDVVVLDSSRVGYGCSGRNGGFVFGGYSLDEAGLLKKMGKERAKSLYRYTTDGIELIRNRIKSYGIDCDVYWDGVLLCNWFRNPKILQNRRDFMRKYFDVDLEPVEPDALREIVISPKYQGGLIEKNAFHFHPLKYAIGLAKKAAEWGVKLYENSRVIRIDPDSNEKLVYTEFGKVKANQIVICCGGYMEGMYKPLSRTMMPIATYVMATEPLGDRRDEAFTCNYAIYDTRFAFDYYRPLHDGRILWGGRVSMSTEQPKNLKDMLYRDLLKVYPQLDGVKIDYAWHGLMSWAAHKMPQIGQEKPGVWYGQSYGGHGVAATNITGDMIAAAIAEGDTRYRDLADNFGRPPMFGVLGKACAEAVSRYYMLRDALTT